MRKRSTADEPGASSEFKAKSKSKAGVATKKAPGTTRKSAGKGSPATAGRPSEEVTIVRKRSTADKPDASPEPRAKSKSKAGVATEKAPVTPRKSAGKDSPATAGRPSEVDADIRHAAIARAAYLRAERRGFAAGGEREDWLEAEREVAQRLDE